MGTARRLYVYVVAGVSLAVLASGFYLLLSLAFGEVGRLLGARPLFDTLTREQVSAAIAMIVVAGPLYAFHWWFAARGLRGGAEAALDERRSALRALYLGLVTFAAFIVALSAGAAVIHVSLGLLLGSRGVLASELGSPIAQLLVGGVIWAYHHRLRGVELRTTQMYGAAMWLSRLTRYGALAVALGLGLNGLRGVIEVGLGALVTPPAFGAGDAVDLVAIGVGFAAVGLVGWWLIWNDAQAAVRDAELLGEDERRTRLRAAYFGGVTLLATATAVTYTFGALRSLIEWVLGATRFVDLTAFAEAVLGPLLAGALPLGVVALLHARYWMAEGRSVGAEAHASGQRLVAYLVALVGLIALAAGTWQLLDIALHSLVDRRGFGGQPLVLNDLATGVAALVVGIALWLPAWASTLRRRAAEPEVEAHAPETRGFLYLVLAGSLLAIIPAAALIVFRLVNGLIGVAGRGLAEDLATPLAVAAVAAVVAAYHGWLLRSAGPAPVAPIAEIAAAPKASVEALSVPLVLQMPAEADLPATLRALRSVLPPGTTLHEQPRS